MPDISAGAPLPPNVQAQMVGPPPMAQPGQGAPGAMFLQRQSSQALQSTLEATQKVKIAMPLLEQIARMVPALAPDAGRLATVLTTQIGGTPSPVNQGPQQGSAIDSLGMAMEPPSAKPSGPMTPDYAAMQQGTPPEQPQMSDLPGGVMGLAVQLEMILPQISGSEPRVATDVEGFIDRMRVEVPKIVEQGRADSMEPPPSGAMLTRLPVSV